MQGYEHIANKTTASVNRPTRKHQISITGNSPNKLIVLYYFGYEFKRFRLGIRVIDLIKST